MVEGWNDAAKLVAGRQVYFLEVPGASSAAELSVVSFEAVERLGDLYKVTIQLTHPVDLDRAEYLNRNATFVIHAGDDSDKPGLLEIRLTKHSQSVVMHKDAAVFNYAKG